MSDDVEMIHLVGAGGTGSHFARMLNQYLNHLTDGVYRAVKVYDGDTVEHNNLGRQDFSNPDLGENKAVVLANRYNSRHVPWYSYPNYLGPGDELPPLTPALGDIVVIAADNHFLRDLLGKRAEDADDAVLINLGNEFISGSTQLHVRRNGENLTPSIRHRHPEIRTASGGDRAAMSCADLALLPGGEQTYIANVTSALFGMVALWRFHNSLYIKEDTASFPSHDWTELHWDHSAAEYDTTDMRITRGWR